MKVVFLLPEDSSTGVSYYALNLLNNITTIDKDIIPGNAQKCSLFHYLRRILNADADVFHIQLEPRFFKLIHKIPFLPLLAFIIKRIRKKVLVITCHAILCYGDLEILLKDIQGLSFLRLFRRILWAIYILINKLMFSLADVIIVHNNLMRKCLADLFNSRLGCKIKVIPHGTRLVSKKVLSDARKNTPVIMYMGFLRGNRDIISLIEAFNILKKSVSNAKLHLILFISQRHQSRSLRKLLMNIVNMSKKSKDVIIQINPEETVIEKVLMEATVGILPYMERTIESSGVAWRYAGMGIPFVATQVPKILADFNFINRSLLLKDLKPENIASAIALLLLNKEMYNCVKQQLMKHARSHSWDKVGKSHEKLYYEVFYHEGSSYSDAL